MSDLIKVAVDAMGGDGSPKKVINGIVHNHRSFQNLFYKIFGDENKIIENPELSLSNGAIAGWDTKNQLYHSMLLSLAKHFEVDLDVKYYKLPRSFKNVLFHGTDEEVNFNIVKLNKKTKRFI